MNDKRIIDQLSALGQAELFNFWEQREESQKEKLQGDLRELDLNLLQTLLSNLEGAPAVKSTQAPLRHLSKADFPDLQKIHIVGETAIAAGKTGYLMVAGGQGSRLGFDGPKGMFPISPLRKASLYQIFSEKILAARRRYQLPQHWYIMTSPLNHQDTIDVFEINRFFGLVEEEVHFFKQGLFPSVTKAGKLTLVRDGGLCRNPDGHGGVIAALRREGLHRHMAAEGLEQLFYFQVDNPLLDIPDPLFLGIHLQQKSEMSSKVVPKISPEEKLGVIGLIDGKPGVIEYSDLSPEQMYARNDRGELLYSHGSIAIHILNVDFLSRSGLNLPLHRALKNVNALVPGARGNEFKEIQVVKFEKFIFDAIPRAENPVFWETERLDEFAPLKNRSGADSIETCVAGIIEKYARWLERNGVAVPRDLKGRSRFKIEISPLYSIYPETLKVRLQKSVNKINEDTLLV